MAVTEPRVREVLHAQGVEYPRVPDLLHLRRDRIVAVRGAGAANPVSAVEHQQPGQSVGMLIEQAVDRRTRQGQRHHLGVVERRRHVGHPRPGARRSDCLTRRACWSPRPRSQEPRPRTPACSRAT